MPRQEAVSRQLKCSRRQTHRGEEWVGLQHGREVTFCPSCWGPGSPRLWPAWPAHQRTKKITRPGATGGPQMARGQEATALCN